MAVDKLVDSGQLNTDLTSVANAIRAKSGGSSQLAFPSGFVSEIGNIPSGEGVSLADFLNSQTTPIELFIDDTVTYMFNYALYNAGIKHIFMSALLNGGGSGYWFSNNTELIDLVLPAFNNIIRNNSVNGCTKLTSVDIGNPTDIYKNAFSGDTLLNTLVIRRTSNVCKLNNISAFSNTPFASGGTGGTLYVPDALISSYQSETNWSTILGYTNNQIVAIEGSIYETQYVDGTTIPT